MRWHRSFNVRKVCFFFIMYFWSRFNIKCRNIQFNKVYCMYNRTIGGRLKYNRVECVCSFGQHNNILFAQGLMKAQRVRESKRIYRTDRHTKLISSNEEVFWFGLVDGYEIARARKLRFVSSFFVCLWSPRKETVHSGPILKESTNQLFNLLITNKHNL